jgi:hypothetical protein
VLLPISPCACIYNLSTLFFLSTCIGWRQPSSCPGGEESLDGGFTINRPARSSLLTSTRFVGGDGRDATDTDELKPFCRHHTHTQNKKKNSPVASFYFLLSLLMKPTLYMSPPVTLTLWSCCCCTCTSPFCCSFVSPPPLPPALLPLAPGSPLPSGAPPAIFARCILEILSTKHQSTLSRARWRVHTIPPHSWRRFCSLVPECVCGGGVTHRRASCCCVSGEAEPFSSNSPRNLRRRQLLFQSCVTT